MPVNQFILYLLCLYFCPLKPLQSLQQFFHWDLCVQLAHTYRDREARNLAYT